MTLKMAVFAPIPNASERIATREKTLLFARVRIAN
jgi:hypothetical protein